MAVINNDTPDTLLSGTNSADTIKNGGYGSDIWHVGGSRVTINAKNGDDYIRNLRGGSQSSINAGAGNDSIENEAAKNVTIDGGKGNDTIDNALMFDGGIGGFRYPDDVIIIGGKGDDLIYNSGSNVLFKYFEGDGNDTIKGFNETSTLSIGGGKYSTTKNGSDIVVTVGNGKISLIGAANLSSVHINNDLIITNASSLVTVTDDISIIDASKRTTAVKITANSLDNTIKGGSKADTIYGGSGDDSILGNAGNDKIYGGFGKDTLSGGIGNDKLLGGTGNDKIYGGTGNDTIIGGTGNDSLWGDAGADTFIYNSGDGKDIIYGFDEKDTLTLDIDVFKTSYSKSSGVITLTFDEGSIKLRDFTASTFHINDDTYKISGSKLKKQ